ncbi:MAG: hypothetical protein Q9175_001596 [Cornicularia normoerica]
MSRYGGETTRVVYRERDVEGSTVSRSAAPRSTNEGYTTRKVYRVSNQDEEEDRTPAFLAPRERTYGETRIVRRERTPEPEPIVERREIRIRERTPEPEPIVERREIRIEREREPEPEPRRYETEYRYDREIDRVAPRRDDLERYVRTVDYYPRQEAPQPIIIRQEPQQIIIQEAPRPPVVVSPPPTAHEESFEVIKRSEARSEVGHRSEGHRSEVGEERQIARRPKPPKPEPEEDEEEDYYYERRTRRIDGRDRDDDEYESSHRRRDRERDVSPGDSISQYGRDRRRDYDSDSSYEYIKRETREDYSDEEPRHRRHLAEGAAVGLGAAELLRHHRKKKGEDEGGRGSRVGKDVGAAALGAIGAEAVTRARSHYRSKSRRGSRDRGSRDRGSRDRDRDREGRRKHKRDKSRGKERSRSESNHRVRNLAGLGLGAAAVAAAVGYANRNAKKSEAQDRRSRSRTRRNSVGALPPPEEADDARNASHRNKKIAQAGLAGAAVAGLVERARSKSRGGGKRDRSKSRLRQGLPIAATALGSAAVAGLYEKQQAGKKEKEARREERAARRSARSRSRSQGYEGSREAPPLGDPALIEYGQDPVYNQGGVPDFYNRPASQQGYYNNTEDAMVPAAAAGAAYGAQAQRDMDKGQRQRSISSESDDARRRRRHRRHKSGSRSRSRSRNATTAALAAGAAGLAASEHEKRKQRKREKKEERRRQELAERASYGQDPYAQQQYQPNSPPPAGFPIEGQQTPYYPPGQEYPGVTPAPVGQLHPDYNYPPQTGYTPPVSDTYSPPPGAAGYPQQPREPRRADENVSAELFHNAANNDVPLSSNNDALPLPNHDTPLYDSNGAPFYYEPNNFSGEGVNTPRPQSSSRPGLQRRASSQPPPTTKTVQFALDTPPSSGPNSPKQIRKRRQHASSSKHSQHDGYDSEDGSSSRDKSRSGRRHHSRSSSENQLESSSPAESDSTVELPERFDERGRPLPQQDDDPMAHIEELLGGRGSVGRLLQNFGLGGGSDDDDGDRDRRRRRR